MEKSVKNKYESPYMEIIEIEVEHGYASSGVENGIEGMPEHEL